MTKEGNLQWDLNTNGDGVKVKEKMLAKVVQNVTKELTGIHERNNENEITLDKN